MNTNTVTKTDKQIVTVAVITYHSAATVLETLDSIVNQSYGPENIELIISDDGSKDNTAQVINDWLVQYQTQFHSVKFFANDVNGGVSKNCNVAWKAATSEWIKTIAGDDLLIENALDTYMHEAKTKPNAKCFFSLVTKFNNSSEVKVTATRAMKRFFNKTADVQYKNLIIDNVIYAPTSFLNRAMLDAVGYADEDYKLIEDFPLWLKLSKSGFYLSLIESHLVKYRLTDSVSRSNNRMVNLDFAKQKNQIMLNEVEQLKKNGFFILAFFLYTDVQVRRLYEWLIVFILRNDKKYSTYAKLISIVKCASPFAIIRLFGF